MRLSHPLAVGEDGRFAAVDGDRHVEQMIEQVLFTLPGERVNRPDFGCGLSALLFEPAHSELTAVTQALVRASLVKWLGDLIVVETLTVEAQDERLTVTIAYARLRDRQRRTVQFTW